MRKPHGLYRIWSADNRLLYVGCSTNPAERIMAHSRTAWATDMDTVKIEWFADRASALAAERTAIETELPEWNVHHRPNPKHATGPINYRHRGFDRCIHCLQRDGIAAPQSE